MVYVVVLMFNDKNINLTLIFFKIAAVFPVYIDNYDTATLDILDLDIFTQHQSLISYAIKFLGDNFR